MSWSYLYLHLLHELANLKHPHRSWSWTLQIKPYINPSGLETTHKASPRCLALLFSSWLSSTLSSSYRHQKCWWARIPWLELRQQHGHWKRSLQITRPWSRKQNTGSKISTSMVERWRIACQKDSTIILPLADI